jgi:hypothetical protein
MVPRFSTSGDVSRGNVVSSNIFFISMVRGVDSCANLRIESSFKGLNFNSLVRRWGPFRAVVFIAKNVWQQPHHPI